MYPSPHTHRSITIISSAVAETAELGAICVAAARRRETNNKAISGAHTMQHDTTIFRCIPACLQNTFKLL